MSLLEEYKASWRTRLKALGLKNYEFTKIADINNNYFSNMKNPPINTVEKIEKAICKLEVGKNG